MTPELMAWIASIPKGYTLAGFKEKNYHGSDQVSLFIAKPKR